jgi:hypothetical protein
LFDINQLATVSLYQLSIAHQEFNVVNTASPGDGIQPFVMLIFALAEAQGTQRDLQVFAGDSMANTQESSAVIFLAKAQSF